MRVFDISVTATNSPEPSAIWRWDRQRLEQWQVQQFNRQLDRILPDNRFYRNKLEAAGIPGDTRIGCLSELTGWPMTTKQELVGSAESDPDGWSHHHTYATHQYSRIHRTSGTKGSPLLIADTAEDWKWWSNTWQHVLAAANVTTEDRVFLAFSFGPFIGFWSAHQACTDRGAMVIPAGGLSSLARLQFLRQTQATVVCCTPTYALHLAEVARSEDFPLTDLPVDRLIVAGESGGSLPEMRSAIENAWKARVIDHAGATEIGPWGFGWPEGCGLHVIESSFIAEIIPLRENIAKTSRDQPASQPPGAARCSTNQDSLAKDSVGELVLTSLGRFGAPVIRYRTGDVVRVTERLQSNTVCNFLWLPNGIIGRTDDMLTVRGVNIFPSSVDSLVRQVAPTAEYLVQVNRDRSMQELLLNIECDSATAGSLQKLLVSQLGLRVNVQCAPSGSLPRSEGKSRRWSQG